MTEKHPPKAPSPVTAAKRFVNNQDRSALEQVGGEEDADPWLQLLRPTTESREDFERSLFWEVPRYPWLLGVPRE